MVDYIASSCSAKFNQEQSTATYYCDIPDTTLFFYCKTIAHKIVMFM